MISPLFSLVLMAGGATADYTVERDTSTLRYHISHKLHRVDATSTAVQGRAVIPAGARGQVMVRADIASFKSGDANRDEHMLETMEAQKFPAVVLKGTFAAPDLANGPKTVDVVLEGELELHGKKERMTLPVTVEITTDSLKVHGTLSVSLDQFGIERPSLLFVKIADTCVIDIDLTLRRTP